MNEKQESKTESPGQSPADSSTPIETAGSRPLASSPLVLTLLLVLLAAVCVQGIMMASLISKNRSTPPPAADEDKDRGQVTPELVARPAAPANPSPSSPLTSQPLGSLLTDDFFSDDWQPFAEMARMRKEMDQLFEDSFQRFRGVPGFNQDWLKTDGEPSISDEGDHLVVTLAIPGADESTLDIKLEDDVLSVSGRREEIDEQRDHDGAIVRRSQSSSQFHRSFSVPAGKLDVAGLESSYQDGKLTIRIPKVPASA